MQPVGLKLLIFPPLPRREADACRQAPGTSRDGGMVGTEARQVFLDQAFPPRRKTIQLLHSSEAPTRPEGEKGPFLFSGIQRSPRDRYGPDKKLSPSHAHAL